jgi:hypothetical protein
MLELEIECVDQIGDAILIFLNKFPAQWISHKTFR